MGNYNTRILGRRTEREKEERGERRIGRKEEEGKTVVRKKQNREEEGKQRWKGMQQRKEREERGGCKQKRKYDHIY